MFCPQCGNENEQGAAFCFSCGTNLEGIDVEEAPTAETQLQGDAEASGDSSPAAEAPAHEPTAEPTRTEQSPASAASPLSSAAGVTALLQDRKRIAVIAAVIVAAIVVLVVAFNASGCTVLGQTPDKFKTAFASDSIVQYGIADDDYVHESAYSITSFSCNNIRKVTDYQVDADIKATIENDNFKTEIVATGTYFDMANNSAAQRYGYTPQGYTFSVKSSATTPKKGIDFDTSNGLSNCQATLSDDATSCSVDVDSTYDSWFVTADSNHVYTYRFDGQRWTFVDETEKTTFEYKDDIEGDYSGRTGTLTNFSRFTISALDAESGTFIIDYTVSQPNVFGWGPDSVSGTVQTAIEPTTEHGIFWGESEEDGRYYCFDAVGSSDSGDGQAKISGYFTASANGECSIQLTSTSIDYSHTAYGISRNERFSTAGTMFKQ